MANALNGRRDTGKASSGVVAVAAVLLLLAGVLNLLRGVMSIAGDDVFVGVPHYTFRFTLTSWGWIDLVLGVLSIVTGVFLFRLALWARIVGVVVAALLILANFLSVPYYPVWSLVVIAACSVVIWGICTVPHHTGRASPGGA
ncbi:hypothetical protein [Kitasatospora sp. NPDC085879]|uniref:DUF7144 family membrane protein n=1 Tax=Kitasatospora sp. NPDC085879 TaxID=3154769 RepID=UPI00342B1961